MINIFGNESRRRRYIIRYYILSWIIPSISLIIGGIVAYTMGHFFWFILAFIIGFIYLILGLIIVIINHRKLSFRRRSQKYDEKTKELYEATEKKLYNYLRRNIGKAYTSQALINRIIESIQHPYFKKYVKKNGERILNKMSTNENIQIARKNEAIHYFFLQQE